MPIYEYKCEKCDCNFEMLLSNTEKKHLICPKCGTHQVKRLMSTTCIGGLSLSNCGPGASGGFS